MKQVQIAFLGMGNVGQGVYEVLQDNQALIAHRDQVQFDIRRVLVRDVTKPRQDLNPSLLTNDFQEILDDDDIEVVVELIGGIHPAYEYIEQLLRKGKTVVTANKEMIAHHWPELEAAAKAGQSGLYYEASVGGGIPIIKTFMGGLQADRFERISAIINGTTNYILTQMTEHGLSFDEVLADAQDKGFAEPDPTNDVDGYDAAHKLSILSSLAFHAKVPFEEIYCEGIRNISVEDIHYGKELGYTLKLLALGKRSGNDIDVRVHPAFVPDRHPLASVHDAYNAIFVEGNAVGKLMLYGRGAGARPTASAVISDMVTAVQAEQHYYNSFVNEDYADTTLEFMDDWTSEYYIRLMVNDQPGVLARVANVFANFGVSIESMVQKNRGNHIVPLIFITHDAREKAILHALDEMKYLDGIESIAALIRVER